MMNKLAAIEACDEKHQLTVQTQRDQNHSVATSCRRYAKF
jgi:hypothetical protein